MKRTILLLFAAALIAASVAGAGVVHVVKKGETLSAISKKYHVPIADILSYNGLKSGTAIKAGQKLKLPPKTAAAKPAAAAPAPRPEPVVSPVPGPAMDTILPEPQPETLAAPVAPAPAPKKPPRMSTKTKFFILFVVQTIVSGLLAYLIAVWVVNRGGSGYKRGP